MKNKILVLCAVMLLALPQKIYAQDIKINIEGNKCDISDYLIKDDRIYVPLRNFGNMFNLFVDWDQSQKEVSVNKIKTQYRNYIVYEDAEGLYGYKDSNKNIVIEPQFRYAQDFSEGLAMVQFNDYSFGFINMKNMIVYKDDWRPVTGFKDGIAIVRRGSKDLSYYNEKTDEHVIASNTETRDFLLDKSGNQISDEYYNILPFSEGMAVAKIEGTSFPVNKYNKFSYIHKNGKLATSLKFKYAESFENGFAEVTTEDGVKGKIDKEFNFYPIEK